MQAKGAVKKRLRIQRCRKLLGFLPAAGLILFGTVGLLLLAPHTDSGMHMRELIFHIVFFAALLGGLVLAGYLLYRWFRYGTALEASVRDQAQGTPLRTLLEEIEQDVAQSPHRFGRVVIGSVWALGDEAMRLEELCGAFAVVIPPDESCLCLVDTLDCVELTPTPLNKAREAVAYLETVCPTIETGDTDAFSAFMTLDGAQRYRRRPRAGVGAWSKRRLSFWGLDGVPTSLFDEAAVTQAVEGLEPKQTVGFTLMEPRFLESEVVGGLFVERDEAGAFMLAATCETGGKLIRRISPTQKEAAHAALQALLLEGSLPNVQAWKRDDMQTKDQKRSLCLSVEGDGYGYIVWEDVLAVIRGFFAGKYKRFSLNCTTGGAGGLFVQRDREGNCCCFAAIPRNRELQWMQTVTTREDQIVFWFSNYFMSGAFPYSNDWSDVTDRFEKGIPFSA